MAMVRKSGFCLTGCVALALAGTSATGAQDVPDGEGGGNIQFGQGGGQPQRGPGLGGGQGRFGGGAQIPGMPGGMMGPTPMMPEMAKRMMAIMALRQINGIGLTSRDISNVLPILKNMRDAEKNLENRSIQILDEEKKALLAAQPDSPLPADSGQRLQEATMAYHQQRGQGWEAIVKAVGPDKAGGIHMLVEGGGGFGGGQPGQPGFGPFGGQGGAGGFGGGAFGGEGGTGGIGGGGFGGQGGAGGVPGLPGGAGGAGGGGFGGQGGAGGAPGQPGQPGGAGFGGQGGAGGFGGGGFGGQGGAGGGFPGGAGGRGGQGGGPGLGGGQGGRGRVGGINRPGMPGQMGGGFAFGGPQIALNDLVELLEQKLAAMRK